MKLLVILLFSFCPLMAWNPWKSICIRDCCGDFYYNESNLKENMEQKLFGQPLVQTTVIQALRSHLKTLYPDKAMVLSFHGWTGSGKNYVSQMVAEAMFKNGMKSSSVKLFISTVDFSSASNVDQYKEYLTRVLTKQIKRCSRALFIFDEMDKMPIGLIDVIKPFLEYHHEVSGVDPRTSVFLFLSNTGGKVINEMVYSDWLSNKPREGITLAALRSGISKSAFNEVKGGLWHSFLIESHVITSFIPFLPMERKHVMLCVEAEFKKRGFEEVKAAMVEAVADQITYWPEDTKLLSSSGCKRIPQLVNMHITSLGLRARTEL